MIVLGMAPIMAVGLAYSNNVFSIQCHMMAYPVNGFDSGNSIWWQLICLCV